MQTYCNKLLVFTLFFFLHSAHAAEKPPLSLAESYQPGIDLSQYWVSEKLDGVRAYWNGKALISRQGNIINAPQWFTAALPTESLDGELWVGRGHFEQTVATISKHKPIDSEWRQLRYMVFDLPSDKQIFDLRLQRLQQLIPKESSIIKLIPQWKIDQHSQLQHKLALTVQQGGEGLMLHRGDAHYHSGRNRDILKFKPYYDAEATVIAYKKGQGKHQGRMGSLLVESAEGTRFYIGTGFSDKQRENPPAIGTLISFRYYGLTQKGIPRHASFIRVRPDTNL